MQARSDNGVWTTSIPAGLLRVIGPRRPLEVGIRRTMERFFGADFSGVSVHEGPAAQALGALALTLGEELHFAPGLYAPASRDGVELLGHELAHVVQQRAGRITNPHGQGIAIVQDPELEAEADRMGQRIADAIWTGTAIRPRPPAILPALAGSPLPILQIRGPQHRVTPSHPGAQVRIARSIQPARATPRPLQQRVASPLIRRAATHAEARGHAVQC